MSAPPLIGGRQRGRPACPAASRRGRRSHRMVVEDLVTGARSGRRNQHPGAGEMTSSSVPRLMPIWSSRVAAARHETEFCARANGIGSVSGRGRADLSPGDRSGWERCDRPRGRFALHPDQLGRCSLFPWAALLRTRRRRLLAGAALRRSDAGRGRHNLDATYHLSLCLFAHLSPRRG